MSTPARQKPEVMRLATAERSDLADFLAELSPEQWESPTLCDAWTVREVVVHIVSYDDLGMRGTAARLLRGRLSFDRTNDLSVDVYADAAPAAVLSRLRDHLRPSGPTARFGGRVALTDGLIHHQDIRRALGMPRAVPVERLRLVLPFALLAPPLPSRRDVRGLRLVATDLEWSHGEGPELTGPGEALMMAIAGRRDALAELDGPGVPLLAQRMEVRRSEGAAVED